MKFNYPLSIPNITELEINSVLSALMNGEVAQGEKLLEFEQSISKIHQDSKCALVNSGTAALHIALKALGVRENDFVLVPNNTFAATLFAVTYLGATPVIVDFEAERLTFDLELLEQAITTCIALGNKPRVLITVDLYGHSCDYEEIRKITDKYEILILEDAAEGLGATYLNEPVGTFGDLSILSFNANKIITTGGGGAVISHNGKWIEEIKYLANQAKHGYPHFIHDTVGYNYRLSNLAAAVGVAQLERLPDFLRKKKSINDYYAEHLNGDGFEIVPNENKNSSNYWLSLLRNSQMSSFQEDLMLILQRESIETRPGWRPMTLQPAFKNYPSFVSGQTENWYTQILALPSNLSLTESDLEFIIQKVKLAIKRLMN